MPDTAVCPELAAQHQTERAWALHNTHRAHPATIGPWTTTTAPDGTPIVTARLHGPDAVQQLLNFGSGPLITTGDDGQRPTLDYTEPAITAVEWRTAGVWARLEARDPLPVRPIPTPRNVYGTTPLPPAWRRHQNMLRALSAHLLKEN
ncbi:hypothetical protein ACFV3R_24965 [Streptomyces sp. NPDC059740]|uniref:hypothetical protein n=1 Tax=Streptomyces sp. NPDC059740 TaxID=3346926 RepID=UPI0036572167